MKKVFGFLLGLAIAFSNSVFAVGFQDTTNNVTTVNQVLKMKDNTFVTVKGNITKQISNDEYMFQDSTGSIIVEIDELVWQGQNVNKKDTLELTGEIDRDFNKIKLEVSSLKKVTK